MTQEELIEDFAQFDEPKFRAEQVFKWISSGVEDFSQMTNISINLRNMKGIVEENVNERLE